MDFSPFFDYPQKDIDTEHQHTAADFVLLPQWHNNDWQKLLEYTQTYLYSTGDIVIQADDLDRSLYLVGAGTLEVLVPRSGRGAPLRIALIESGSIIGEQAFLDGRMRSATVRAVEDCQLFRLSPSSFEIFAAREPQLARSLLFELGRIVSLRLRGTMSHLPSWD